MRAVVVVSLFAFQVAAAQQRPPADSVSHDCRVAMIPMRDGAKLNTKICVPRGNHAALPFILTRTPYGIAELNEIGGSYRFLAADGYIFVYQDIRGRFASEGKFFMNRPLRNRADARATDETTDAYDTVDWLLKNVPDNNGRVGVVGVSYGGFLATMAGIDAHPAVKAISPQAPMTDTWMGDDFFHQGAFRLSYGFEYGGVMEMSKDLSAGPPIGAWDMYGWYLDLGPLSNVDAKFFRGKLPTWEAFIAHPAYDAFWKARAVDAMLRQSKVPTLAVGGWWDQEDRYGPLATFRALQKNDSASKSMLVMGPWNHGGWRNPAARMAVVDPGTADYFLQNVEAPWFAYWLKDKGTLPQRRAYVFDAGAAKWRSFEEWPPRTGATERALYLHGDGKLSFTEPAATELPFDQYISDPAHPVPYRPRPIEQTYDGRGSRWAQWETEDQRFVDGRPDVAHWVSDPLTDDVVIAGDVIAHIVTSTTGRDADWVVKLIDVFPDSVPSNWKLGGYELMVAHEIMRGRYRKSYSAPEPLQPDTPLDFTVDLHQQAYDFRKGHRIMVQVQSSWFPLYDRNPQTWVKNIFQAKAGDFHAQTHRVWHTPKLPSHVSVTVIAPPA